MAAVAIVLALALTQAAPSVHAAAYVVNSLATESDDDPGDGVCATAGGFCTFQAAAQEIHFGAGVISFSPALAGTISYGCGDSGPPSMGSGSITGNGLVTLHGCGHALFAGAGVTIRNMSFLGFNVFVGPGTLVEGNTVTSGLVQARGPSTVRGNTISGGPGSGIQVVFSGGSLVEENTLDGAVISVAGLDDNIIQNNEVSNSLTFGISVSGNHNIVRGNSVTGNFSGNMVVFGDQNIIDDNLISGSNAIGLQIGTTNSEVTRNLIGTDASGMGPLPNGIGVLVAEGAQDNLIGSTEAGQGNIIAFNDGTGVAVLGPDSVRNTIRGNSIHSNGVRGIELVNGGNKNLRPPVLLSLAPISGTACPNCTVDVYSDSEDEGRVLEGSVTADASGTWSFGGSVQGPNVTATATDADGNTSKFTKILPDISISLSFTVVGTSSATRNTWSAAAVTTLLQGVNNIWDQADIRFSWPSGTFHDINDPQPSPGNDGDVQDRPASLPGGKTTQEQQVCDAAVAAAPAGSFPVALIQRFVDQGGTSTTLLGLTFTEQDNAIGTAGICILLSSQASLNASVLAHELGHALCLDHQGVGPLGDKLRDDNLMWTPKAGGTVLLKNQIALSRDCALTLLRRLQPGPTLTATSTPTATPTPSPTGTATATPTSTLTPTSTPEVPVPTPICTVPAPATPTFTPIFTPTMEEPEPATPTNTCSATPTRTRTRTPTRTPAPAGGARGDATCDGVANSLDSLYILQFYAALLRALPCPQNADVNRDGVIDARDSLLILQLDAGLIHGLPAGAAGGWHSPLAALW